MTHHIVITEFDGNKPPSVYYSRLHRLGLNVRRNGAGNKDRPVIARRAESGYNRYSNNMGVVAQEGVILCSSASMAQLIGNLALQHGASFVQVGVADLEPVRTAPADTAALDRIQVVLGRRGKPLDPSTWTVTCLEELSSMEVEARGVAVCPDCGGANIVVRQGPLSPVRINPQQSLIENWQTTRFTTGRFEIPDIDPKGQKPVPANIKSDIEKATAKSVQKSPELTHLLDADIPDSLGFEVLDAIFSARAHHSTEIRNQARAAAYIAYVRKGGNPMSVSLVERAEPDLLDTATCLGAKRTSQLLLQYVEA
jgi:hypothetical protein